MVPSGADRSDTPPRDELARRLAGLVVSTTREYTGRGPTSARAYIQDDLVTVVLGDVLSRGERSLADDGREQEVLRMRQAFQETMRVDLVEGVERLTGRKVIAFLSANHLDPDVAIESFVLAPMSPA